MKLRPTISGFTIVRNAELLDYPFKESVLSVLPLCDEFVINCGDSEDKTREVAEELKSLHPNKIKIFDSIWKREAQLGGYQLKSQTDFALSKTTGDWCFYIQADEVLHEKDFSSVLLGINDADSDPDIDGLLFNYLHFYGNFSYQIQGRNWYRREVRLFKNNRNIEAFRDAQGFRRNGARLRVSKSRAEMFHYGYVRSSESLRRKSEQMSQWWGERAPTNPEAFALKNHVGLKLFKATHPRLMQERLLDNGLYVDPSQCKRIWDKNEIKNAITLIWESLVPFRIGEFRNYELG